MMITIILEMIPEKGNVIGYKVWIQCDLLLLFSGCSFIEEGTVLFHFSNLCSMQRPTNMHRPTDPLFLLLPLTAAEQPIYANCKSTNKQPVNDSLKPIPGSDQLWSQKAGKRYDKSKQRYK